MTEAISTGDEVLYTAPTATVSIAGTLGGDFEEQEYLFLKSLRRVCGPDVDTAVFTYRYGPQFQHDSQEAEQFDPLELNNKFVRVEINSATPIVWHGVFEFNQMESDGSFGDTDPTAEDPAGEPAGEQELVAYGLLRLLERDRIYSTTIQRSGEFTVASNYLYGYNSGLSNNDLITVSSSGTLPAGLSALTDYYVINKDNDKFQVALGKGGSAVTISDTGSGGPHVWTGGSMTIDHGLAFNADDSGTRYSRGNRAAVVNSYYANSTDDSEIAFEDYIFAATRRSSSVWTAEHAVKYTLAHDAPLITDVVNSVEWKLEQLEEGGAPLRWADFSVDRDGRTAKEVIDSIIDRRRGVWYRVEFDEVVEEIKLHVGTFTEDEITTTSGNSIPANPNTRTLDFEQAIDIESAVVRNIASQTFDTVYVQGEFKTSTFTAYCTDRDSVGPLIPDWTETEETTYLDAANGVSGYDDANKREEAFRRNKMAREDPQVAHVFSRFRISTMWHGRIEATFIHADNPSNEYWVWPPLDGDAAKGDDGDPVPLYHATTNKTPGGEIWRQGAKFEPRLTLKERLDYTGTQITGLAFADDALEPLVDFLKPMFLVKTGDINDKAIYEFGDRVATDFEASARKWNLHGRVLDSGPQLEFRARPANHLVALNEWNTKDHAITEPEHDPRESAGVDWDQQLFATVTIRLPERVHRIEKIRDPDPGGVERVLWINLQNKRLDYVVPYTIVGVDGGERTHTTSGGFVRDDRNAMEDIAKAAATWYGTTRQSLELVYRQVEPHFELGWLITDVGAGYNLTDVNTVVTAIVYDLTEGRPRTTIETSYVDLEF